MFSVASSRAGARTILCLGAHSDDIEIGCGGTLLSLVRQYPDCDVTWVVFSASGEREVEARASAARFLDGARSARVLTRDFKESFFPYRGEAIKEFFEEVRRTVEPDLVFTHHRHDLHQDHRVVAELTLNTFRRHAILEYEIPKYDGDLGQPNVYVPLAEPLADLKVRNLLDGFPSQRARPWFTEDTFRALLRLRGLETPGQPRYAEAFHGRKVVLGFGPGGA